MTPESAVWVTIAFMALAVFLTRQSGAVVMCSVKSNPWIERFLGSLSRSVIIAIIASAAAQGDLRVSGVIVVAATTAILARSALTGMIVGTAAGALWRFGVGA